MIISHGYERKEKEKNFFVMKILRIYSQELWASYLFSISSLVMIDLFRISTSHRVNFGNFYFLENHIFHPDLYKAEKIVPGGVLISPVSLVIQHYNLLFCTFGFLSFFPFIIYLGFICSFLSMNKVLDIW